ncbi:AraC family transcriptional regulator [Planctopirus limnophila]|nr:helix-turn-helix domain-containing protein [Planctopirus limnophila]
MKKQLSIICKPSTQKWKVLYFRFWPWYVLTMDHDAGQFQKAFFSCQPLAESLMSLFDSMPQTYFYAKDRNSRFVKVNHLFLEKHGLSRESEAIGRSDFDFHPPVMAEAYIAEDQRVMESRKPLGGQLWQVIHRRVSIRWYVSTKTPLFDLSGEVIGLAGAMYEVAEPEQKTHHFQELLPVINYVEEHYAETIVMADMAKLAGLSSTHFNRRFQELLRMTPTQYLRQVRIQTARQLLTFTSRSLADIAADTGFTDQSHFTKRFRESTGLTPEAYRKKFLSRQGTGR